MRKGFIPGAAFLVILFATGCSTTPPATPPGVAPPTALSSTTVPPSTNVPSTNPTIATPSTSSPAPSVALTTPIPTTTQAPPTPVIPSGLYATSLDMVPDPPMRGVDLEFYATFANTTGTVQTFRWIVYLYRSDNPTKSYGETTATNSSIPLGAQTQKSLGYWKLPLGGPCEDFTARVAWIDQNNQSAPFLRPDGKIDERAITVCAPSDLPPSPAP
jgi:hypothetical protein